MFSIGDFARHGRVSVRMLRHYDAIGLLRPAAVDRATGYRSYEAQQLARLNRIVALKDLGFTLQQVQSILDDKVSVEELRGMLRLRQAELQTQIASDSARLAQVGARLQVIEREGAMPADDVQVKRIPGVRVAELTGTAAGFEPQSISPVIQPLYDDLWRRIGRAGLTPTGPAIRARARRLGMNGPRKSLRIPSAASRLKTRPGRMRTTRIPGCSDSKRSSSSRIGWYVASLSSTPYLGCLAVRKNFAAASWNSSSVIPSPRSHHPGPPPSSMSPARFSS